MSSLIMMVAPTPARRDHLALIVKACMHPAGSCKTSGQCGEQLGFIAQRGNTLFSALWSGIVCSMSAISGNSCGRVATSGNEGLKPARF